MAASFRDAVTRVDTSFAAVALGASACGELDRTTAFRREVGVTGMKRYVAAVSIVSISDVKGDVPSVS